MLAEISFTPFFIIPAAVCVVVMLNVLTVMLIIRRAVRKNVKPELHKQGVNFIRSEWAGFFSSDFEQSITFTPLANRNGKSGMTVYAYVFYTNGNNQQRVTIKIETIALRIKQITYSHPLNS